MSLPHSANVGGISLDLLTYYPSGICTFYAAQLPAPGTLLPVTQAWLFLDTRFGPCARVPVLYHCVPCHSNPTSHSANPPPVPPVPPHYNPPPAVWSEQHVHLPPHMHTWDFVSRPYISLHLPL